MAWYYLRFGTFWLDLLAALPWPLELAYFTRPSVAPT